MQLDTKPKPPRQLLIALDAMDWGLLEKWSSEGKLPNFRRLIEEGTRAKLRTTAEQLPDTVLSSLYTGSNPAKLEKYFYCQYDPETVGLKYLPDEALKRPAFWDYLSRAGKRVGVIDPPKFPASRELSGFQLTNWGAHATSAQRSSTPASLMDEVEKRFGKHPIGACDAVDDKPEALKGLRERIIEGAHLRGRVCRWLMENQEWDVFFVVFSETHCVGHHFWRFVDPTHPRHNEEDTHGLADTIEQVYRAIDEEIGEMIELAGEDTLTMVFAGHGMGPIYHASWNLPEILDLLGYGREPAVKRDGNEASGNQKAREAKVNPWRILKMILPGRLQYFIKESLPLSWQHRLLFKWYKGGRDWRGCRAFSVPNNDSVGAIRLSVKGRDRDGLVEPGEEYERVCQDIAAALYELTDPVTGRAVVKRVTFTHEEFHGPYLDGLPDITVLWDQSFAWESLHSPRFGTLRLRTQDSRSGSHTPLGFVLVKGAGVPAGVELANHSIYDIAATVLEVAGVAAPSDLDGQPLPVLSLAVTA
ncbi:MAG TPA: alkaline phosphatase family protein [Pyrinomonadaceae bacterium]|nr:alkaline phosphatase family protein [Pyrinomonadaceae bacterium]